MKPPSVAQTMLKFTTERVGILCGSRDASVAVEIRYRGQESKTIQALRKARKIARRGLAPRHGRDECGSCRLPKVKRSLGMETTHNEGRLSS